VPNHRLRSVESSADGQARSCRLRRPHPAGPASWFDVLTLSARLHQPDAHVVQRSFVLPATSGEQAHPRSGTQRPLMPAQRGHPPATWRRSL